MIYPQNLEEKLGFDRIRKILHDLCISPLGQALVEDIAFSIEYELINQTTQQVAEFCDILQQEESFPQQNYIDARDHLRKAAPEGAFLLEAEFFDLKLSLSTIFQCLKYFKRAQEDRYPRLQEIVEEVIFDKSLISKIELVIDDRGKLRDDASFHLRQIRAAIIAEEKNLRKRLDQIIKSNKKNGYTPDDLDVTIRNGRLVLPMIAEHKRKIRGIVHGESATGQTVFMEPADVIDMNNYISELQYEERREIVRILTQLTDELRPHLETLHQAFRFLAEMDFIQAKAKLALEMQAVCPQFHKKCVVDWREARHPLLHLAFMEQGKQVIPLNLSLHPDQRILLISGPNAGGKSVSLKTVGLVQYMFQSGLLVPMDEKSTIGLFKDIFIDIGDEQSIENDLSTYSSHLTNMKFFLKMADKHSLCLIDEFGTGTEPQMGGAIAEAILERLYHAQCTGVLTTHYANLKLFAEQNPGIVNGAMQFNLSTLEPSYSLEVGKPGSSYAFEIAQKIGLPDEVISKARDNAGTQKVNFDDVLKDLELEKKRLEVINHSLESKEDKLKQVTQEYDKLKAYLDKEKRRILDQAKREGRELIMAANRKIEQTIREIKENQAQKEKTRELRQDLEALKEDLTPELPLEPEVLSPQEEEASIKVIEGEIQVGDFVRLKGQNTIGEVIARKGKDLEILIGDLKSNVKLNRLERISKKEFKKEEKNLNTRFKGINIHEKQANFNTKLDLRGKRGEEALLILDTFMDDAILLNQSQLQIVHGKGDGILKKLVREQLKKYPQISRMSFEHPDRGGEGITLVSMK